jgi:hypothetical protein
MRQFRDSHRLERQRNAAASRLTLRRIEKRLENLEAQ